MKRKGISPLIAAVLLIAFTMAVAAILTAFVTTFTQETTGQVGNQSQQLIVCSEGVLDIISADESDAGSPQWVNVTWRYSSSGNNDLAQGVTVIALDSDDAFIASNTTQENSAIGPGNISSTIVHTGGTSTGSVEVRSVQCEGVRDTEDDVS